MENALGPTKQYLKYKLLAAVLNFLSPVIIVLLAILTIIAPLSLLFMGNDSGASYSVKYDGTECSYTSDMQGWTSFLASKKQMFQKKIKERGAQRPHTENMDGQPIDSYTDVQEHYFTNEGQSTYVTDNSKEILSMMMVYFEQEYSDGNAIFRYLNDLFNASHHATYEESSLYGCPQGCQERTYQCSDPLDGIYSNCFSIPEEQYSRQKKHELYEQHNGCPDHYEERTFYCHDGNGIDKASDYQKKIYAENHGKGGCALKHGIRYDTHSQCNDYSEITYLQFTQKRLSWMPKSTVIYKWDMLRQCWTLSINGNTHRIYPNTSPGREYLTKGKNGPSLHLQYDRRLDRYEYHNSYYQCKEYTCPGHTENVPGSCLGEHVEKICYGHVDLEANICVDTFPQIYNDDIRGNLTGNAEPGESLGLFLVTAYCPCPKCCGKFANGITASGTVATEGRTIAVDPQKIPYGTRLVMNGHVYVAEDCGSGVNGNHIDLFMNSHENALRWGSQLLEVFYEAEEGSGTENENPGTGLEKGSSFTFTGWDKEMRDWVDCLYDMDWEELYGIRISQSGASPITDSDIGRILESMPEGTDEVRKKIVETAVSMAGKIPYSWGGSARGPGASGIPFAGLDCSHFVDWVYWTAIGNNLGNGNTETLWGVSKDIAQRDLKPGDLGFRYIPSGYGGTGGTDGHTNHVGIFVGKDNAGNEIWVHENGTADNVSVGIYNGFSYYRQVLNDT